MIEKIMKSVKRGNKKRSINITIGAVVGFLLSCTSVMGADEYLWIKEDGGIKFSINDTEPSLTEDPYKSKNSWDESTKTYTNNMTLTGTLKYGLKLEGNLGEFKFINNGSITGTSTNEGFGIRINRGSIEKLTNNGSITGTITTTNGEGYGIFNLGSITNLINNGSVIGTAKKAIAIANGGTIEYLTNNGLITGTATNSAGYGINNAVTITELTNNGSIIGTGEKAVGIANGGTIEKLTNNGSITGTETSTSSESCGISNESRIGELTNNGLITVATTGRMSAGIINLNNGSIGKLTNNGLIIGTVTNGEGYGVYNVGTGTITELTNNGLITGTSTGDNGDAHGINNAGTMTELINNSLITGTSTGDNGDAHGINNAGTMTELINNSLITGTSTGSGGKGYGIYNNSGFTIGSLANNGLITGIALENSNESHGVYNDSGTITTLTNTGVIYGKTHAVWNNSGTISSFNNYGLLISEADNTVKDAVLTGNEGLIFKATGGKYTAKTDDDYGKFGKKYDSSSSGYIIINAKAVGAKENITGTESLSLDKGALTYGDSEEINISSSEKYILNGITDTLLVSGNSEDNVIANSVINAYGTAVVFDGAGGKITLSGTVVNGGIEEITNLGGEKEKVSTILGSVKEDTLILQNTIVNGNVNMGGQNDALTVGAGTIINGTLDGGDDEDILNFGIASKFKSTPSTDDNINILNNISNFENINIGENTKVTFFEDVKVTGANTVTVAETGVLNLRLKDSGSTINVGGTLYPKATHAFSGNNMIVQGEGNGVDIAGTLNFGTNGIGKEIYVDMENIELKNLYIKTSSIIDGYDIHEKEYVILGAYDNLDKIYRPENTRAAAVSGNRYDSLNNIYKGIYSSTGDNLDALRTLISFNNFGNSYDENMSDEEQLKNLMSYLSSIYTESPYSYSAELSRRSMGMFRDIVTENNFKPDVDKWLIMGGLTHADGGTRDTYYGQNYHEFDTGTADTDVDMKLTGAYALGKYGYSENLSLGITVGGNKSEAEMSMSKVKGNSGYVGAFAENYRGNLTLKAGAGIQYSEYDADRRTMGGHSYDEKYSDMAYDIYLNGRYSHNIGDNLFLEPYGTLSYTYVDQDGANEGNQALAIETDSKSFDYTTAKAGVDLKKVIPHEKGKSTLSAGVSYTRILDGADEEYITGRFKGGSDFDILVAHKNEHSIGLNVKYSLELENGILFDVKGTYAVERDSHNQSGKNKNKGEWIVGAGIGYKF